MPRKPHLIRASHYRGNVRHVRDTVHFPGWSTSVKNRSISGRPTSVISASRMAARSKLVGAHPAHSDIHHAMTGAHFVPKAPKLHVPKPPRAPKMSKKII